MGFLGFLNRKNRFRLLRGRASTDDSEGATEKVRDTLRVLVGNAGHQLFVPRLGRNTSSGGNRLKADSILILANRLYFECRML